MGRASESRFDDVRDSLQKINEGCRSIAFPAIGPGLLLCAVLSNPCYKLGHRSELASPSGGFGDQERLSLSGSDSVYRSEPELYGLPDAGFRIPMLVFDKPPAAAAPWGNVNNFYVLNTLHQLHMTTLAKNYEGEDWIERVEHSDYMILESDFPLGIPPEFHEGGLAWSVVHVFIDRQRLMGWQKGQMEMYNSSWNITA
ncbi:hypothetical protein CERZMDRAFT_92348 [Cercospora zeae-maydis SCOH1-5]|uniref:Uncharacterized protein n=1 Tax=Cercospora zeae-maydis SCOH1-5 TaxID=717836 RepID=A0A6A6FWB0_9PEZI|nr:hypothetical protein CERZMDRAFT_92348 [Cercospora zeae-maydis SCOH1-5]